MIRKLFKATILVSALAIPMIWYLTKTPLGSMSTSTATSLFGVSKFTIMSDLHTPSLPTGSYKKTVVYEGKKKEFTYYHRSGDTGITDVEFFENLKRFLSRTPLKVVDSICNLRRASSSNREASKSARIMKEVLDDVKFKLFWKFDALDCVDSILRMESIEELLGDRLEKGRGEAVGALSDAFIYNLFKTRHDPHSEGYKKICAHLFSNSDNLTTLRFTMNSQDAMAYRTSTILVAAKNDFLVTDLHLLLCMEVYFTSLLIPESLLGMFFLCLPWN